VKPAAGYRPLAYSSPEAVQTTGTVADFPVIRARIEELRRERVPAPTEPEARPLPPRPYHTASAVTPSADQRRPSPAIGQKLFR